MEQQTCTWCDEQDVEQCECGNYFCWKHGGPLLCKDCAQLKEQSDDDDRDDGRDRIRRSRTERTGS